MRVESLRLAQYRNYASLSLTFPGLLNVFIGKNAQGKTNLLESLYLLATGRSVRTHRDADLIQWHAAGARVRAEVARADGTLQIDVQLQAGVAKRIRLNGQPIRRLADLFGYLNVVAFTPDDMQLVKGSPSQRRQFLDYEIAQVSPAYRDHLGRYNRILKQRNQMLKAIADGNNRATTLDVWDEQMVEHGCHVMAKRAAMVQSLSLLAGEKHRHITEGREHLEIGYVPFFNAVLGEEALPAQSLTDMAALRRVFVAALERMRRVEWRRGVSMVGPQRDDLAFHLNGVDARTFGSQGQQRTTVLACKLAEIAYMEQEVGEPPILLLDDVMSELDMSRRSYLVEAVQDKVQTFITSANAADLGDALLARADVFHIVSGTVEAR